VLRVAIVGSKPLLTEDESIDLETPASDIPDELALVMAAGCEERLFVLADDADEDKSVGTREVLQTVELVAPFADGVELVVGSLSSVQVTATMTTTVLIAQDESGPVAATLYGEDCWTDGT